MLPRCHVFLMNQNNNKKALVLKLVQNLCKITVFWLKKTLIRMPYSIILILLSFVYIENVKILCMCNITFNYSLYLFVINL